MQSARNYPIRDAASGMEHAALAAAKPFPASIQRFARYVEQLLTPEEQRICDMATD